MQDLKLRGKICKGCNMYFNDGPPTKEFCKLKCKNKYHNQLAQDPNNIENIVIKDLRQNDRILKKIFHKDYFHWKKTREILKHEGYDFSTNSDKVMNPETGRPVYFNYHFGLELNEDNQTFCLGLRDNKKEIVL
jgi:hypothetical protein